jgi:hypothetical protein
MRRRNPDSSSTVEWAGKQPEAVEPPSGLATVELATVGRAVGVSPGPVLLAGIALVGLDVDDEGRHESTCVSLSFPSKPMQQDLEHITRCIAVLELCTSAQQSGEEQGATALAQLPSGRNSWHSACSVSQVSKQYRNSVVKAQSEICRLGTAGRKMSLCTAAYLDSDTDFPLLSTVLVYAVHTRSRWAAAARTIPLNVILLNANCLHSTRHASRDHGQSAI